MRIAIDAMGGDHGPGGIIDGALVAAGICSSDSCLSAIARIVERELGRHPAARALDIEILDAPDSVEMRESAAAALRRKPRASIRVAAEAVRDGRADALFSAGHTGAIGDGGACGVRTASGRRPACPRDDRPDRETAGGPPRLRRDGGLPPAAPACSSRSWGRPTPRWRSGARHRASGCCRSARKRARATI